MFLETPYKRKLQFKKLPPIFLNEQVGTSVTLNCPVKPSVVRMYRYLRRIKSGKELEQARRQMGHLLGVKYKWYKDGKPIRHHRSAWFMKLQAVHIEDAGIYTCKVAMPKHGTSRNFVLKVFSKCIYFFKIPKYRPRRKRKIRSGKHKNIGGYDIQ